MHRAFHDEYKLLTSLSDNVTSDITRYSSLLLAGSVTIILGVGTVALSDKVTTALPHSAGQQAVLTSLPNLLLFMSAVFLSLALVALLIFILLQYKFESHNRILGFRAVLSRERLTFGPEPAQDPSKDDEVYYSFDFCMNKLNELGSGKLLFPELFAGLKDNPLVDPAAEPPTGKAEERTLDFFKKAVAKATPRSVKFVPPEWPREDRPPWGAKTGFLWETMRLKVKADSWGFPVYSTFAIGHLFAVEWVFGCVFFGLYMYWEGWATVGNTWTIAAMSLFAFANIIIILRLRSILTTAFEVMKGSRNIPNYYLRFIPARIMFLNRTFKDYEVHYV